MQQNYHRTNELLPLSYSYYSLDLSNMRFDFQDMIIAQPIPFSYFF